MIADVDTDMRDTADLFTHGAFEEHQITRPGFFCAYSPAHTVQTVCTAPAYVINTGSSVHIADKAGAVKGCFRRSAAPHIWISDILVRFLHKLGKVRVSVQRFLGDIVDIRIFQRDSVPSIFPWVAMYRAYMPMVWWLMLITGVCDRS